MLKEEFTDKYRDELCGFVLAAMVQDEKSDMAMKGRFMLNHMRRAHELLDRMFAESRTLEQVKNDAKSLSEEDRALFRAWIEAQPKKTK